MIAQFYSSYQHLSHLQRTAAEGVRVTIREDAKIPIGPAGQATTHQPPSISTYYYQTCAKNKKRVVDADILEIWTDVLLSPFGVVAKGDKDPALVGRTIHDLSQPEGASINDITVKDETPTPTYEPCTSVASELLRTSLKSTAAIPAKLMGGDVASAFRNVAIHSESVRLFGGYNSEVNAVIIDLFAPFG